MTSPTEGIDRRIEQLKVKLRAREGHAAYKLNCEEIRAELVRLEERKAHILAGKPV